MYVTLSSVKEVKEVIKKLIETLEKAAASENAYEVKDVFEQFVAENGTLQIMPTIGYNVFGLKTSFHYSIQQNETENVTEMCACGDADCVEPNVPNEAEFIYADRRTQLGILNENRIIWLTYVAWLKEVTETFRDSDEVTPDMATTVMNLRLRTRDEDSLDKYLEMLKKLLDIKVSTNSITFALEQEKIVRRDINRYLEIELNSTQSRTLSSKISEIRETREYDEDAIENEIQRFQEQVHNGITARTWGWEIEAPAPGDINVPAGVEKGYDGSVESYESSSYDDCQCECRECRYHECDCSNCEDYNDSPEHCGDSDYCASGSEGVEFRTTGGLIRAQHPGMLNLLNQIKDTEINETAGTHIHIYAKDLSAEQVGVVLGGYALTQRIWDVLAGRDVNNDQRCKTYADLIPAEYAAFAIRRKILRHVGKFNAVNTHHINSDRGTLEFRQMNCNFDYKRITFMAWMARGLVETAKNGAKIHEFFSIKNIEGIIQLYAKYGYKLDKEWVGERIEDPIGSRYNQSRNRVEVDN